MGKKKKGKQGNLVVIDLEMCRIYKKIYVNPAKKLIRVKKETIQIGAVLLDGQGNVRNRFEMTVRPEYGKLDKHVQDLTGITSQILDKSPSFADAMKKLDAWLPDGKIRGVSWGTDDRRQLENECRLKHIDTTGRLAALFSDWVDLQAEYGKKTGYGGKLSLGDALRISGIKPEGKFHSAADDAENTAKLYRKVAGGGNIIIDKSFFDEKKRQRDGRREKKSKAGGTVARLPQMDRKSAKENLVIFHGNNLNPLPQDLFMLWDRIASHDYRTYPCACCLNQSYYEIEEYFEEHNAYTSYDDCYWDVTEHTYYAFNTSVGLSLYYDRGLHKRMFAIFMTADGESIDSETLYARNTMVVEAVEWLENEYERWAEFRKRNAGRYIQPYKATAFYSLDRKISALNDITCEVCLFTDHCDRMNCMYPPKIINVPEREQYKINLHILEPCNYRCRHCFAHFDNAKVLPVNVWRHIVDNCAEALYTHEFNIAGGEPLLYKDLAGLIRYIHWTGADCSIITNGYLMDDEWIETNAPMLETIGFSIDSFDPETMLSLGRSTAGGDYLSKERFRHLCEKIREVNQKCRIKVNTVVSAVTKDEDMLSELKDMPVDRWKIIKMRAFKNDEFDNSDIGITPEEYGEFVARNTEGCRVVSEAEGDNGSDILASGDMEVVVERDVQGAYIIVDANGWLIDNSEGESHVPIINCATENFIDGFRRMHLDEELYFSRYGSGVKTPA